MSDLLNQASLVMVPSGYKEDTVYSVIPTDGSGDLAFTRASNGTRVNSAGLVEVCPWNLVQYSEDFANAFWSKDPGATVDSNVATAPNGTTTADRLNFAGAGQAVYTIQTFSGANTFSVYLKGEGANIGKQIYLELPSGQNVTLTGEWQRFQVNADNASSVAIKRLNSGQASSVLAWGIQVNAGTLKPYFPTTDRLNVPRLTYQNGGGGCPSLLLEKQSTNLLSYSNGFDISYWDKTSQGVGSNAVITPNYTTSPDGTNNAFRFQCNLNGGTTTGDRSWMLANFTAQSTVTLSIYIKLNSAGTKTIVFSDSGGQTKTISNTEWQRIDGTFSGGSGEFRIGLIGGLGTSDTLDCSIAFAQAESGSYPTSYIPTTSSSSTRVSDACYKTGISSLIGQTTGSVFVDFELFTFDGYEGVVEITGSQRLLIWRNGTSLILFTDFGAGYIDTTFAIGRHKACFTYTSSYIKFFVDGVKIGQIASTGLTGGFNKLDFENSQGGVQIQRKLINECVVSKSEFTEAEAIALTTI